MSAVPPELLDLDALLITSPALLGLLVSLSLLFGVIAMIASSVLALRRSKATIWPAMAVMGCSLLLGSGALAVAHFLVAVPGGSPGLASPLPPAAFHLRHSRLVHEMAQQVVTQWLWAIALPSVFAAMLVVFGAHLLGPGRRKTKALAAALLGLYVLVVGAASTVAWRAIPGPPIASSDPTWQAMVDSELVAHGGDAAKVSDACLRLRPNGAPDPEIRHELVQDFERVQRICFALAVDRAVKNDDAAELARLEREATAPKDASYLAEAVERRLLRRSVEREQRLLEKAGLVDAPVDKSTAAVMAALSPRLRRCYSRALVLAPKLSLSLKIKVRIDKEGSAQVAPGYEDGLSPEQQELARCAVKLLERVRYPEGPTTAVVPLTFAPAP